MPEFHKRTRDPRFLDARSYVTKGGRVRLFGMDMSMFRGEVYVLNCRTNGGYPMCACGCGQNAYLMRELPDPSAGVIAHNEHGARKSDELHRVKWMRHECHMKSHNCGGKPVPAKTFLNHGK